jgi:hypothetical protein
MKEADHLNESVLVKQFKYQKLVPKIALTKVKSYDPFFNQAKIQQLTSQILSVAGVKGPYSATVMAVLAENNSKKGDHSKAQ